MSEQPARPTADSPAESVEIEVDEEKVQAWDEVKSDYEVEPGGETVPNAMDAAETTGRPEDEEAARGDSAGE